jgi:hypothetical protein
MKKILFAILCLTSEISFAQSKFVVGPSYTFGASSIYGNNMSGMDIGSTTSMTEYGLKWNTGTGVRAEYFFTKRIGIILQSGLMQRGSLFDKEVADYSPRYRFNYIDAVLGVGYRSKEVFKNFNATANMGFSEHTLLNAYRVNSYSAVTITNDIKAIDYGIHLAIGGNTIFFRKDFLQVQLFANAGLTNIFTGIFEMNGIKGRNILYGLQVSYLLGRNPSEKNLEAQ